MYSLRCLEYEATGHPESPERVGQIRDELSKDGTYTFVEPKPCTEDDLLLVHTQIHINRVKNNEFSDPDTPNMPNIYMYASLAVGSAIAASRITEQERSAFSLARPPGHHAERDRAGGFCYFNNIAVAVAKLLEKGRKVAILDLDVHHGNGTQDIFLGMANVLFCSLHQVPLYPGTGLVSEQNCQNFPLPPGTGRDRYLRLLMEALERIGTFRPEILAVSLGFDTYKEDPLAGFNLVREDYHAVGSIVQTIGVPTFFVLEGGYSEDIGVLAVAFFNGFFKNGKKA